jgi:hypothetical protein
VVEEKGRKFKEHGGHCIVSESAITSSAEACLIVVFISMDCSRSMWCAMVSCNT